ncbi:hypothetical protein G6L68_25480 [Agrobacterium fabrum]|uniref:hypothetical protein n=1 Tax=Agrobacterium fabrum TaxID=1176649 RepID=UPI000EF5EDE9|nr:hypothetical protein [Agrobacterium fabrum]AYM66139.1 hypothetical protein At12D13_49870 [Agrobacterium fabrum]NTE63987.1 hypothetical protein [Agrobacterium fabrum]
MADASDFDFDYVLPDDDQVLPTDSELEDYLSGKIMTPEEEDALRRHAAGEAFFPPEIIMRIAARYQRGELGELLPVIGPLLQSSEKDLAADFFSKIEEQDDENVFLMYRLAVGRASEIGLPMPEDARPIDERPMDLIEVARPWPAMSSIAIH